MTISCKKCDQHFDGPKTYRNHKRRSCKEKEGSSKNPSSTVIPPTTKISVSLSLNCPNSNGIPIPNNLDIPKATIKIKTSPATGDSNQKQIIVEPERDTHYGCKLCQNKLPDKPLILYHLVSLHRDELQFMGQKVDCSGEAGANDKLVNDLSVKFSGAFPVTAGVSFQFTGESKQNFKKSCDEETSSIENEKPDPNSALWSALAVAVKVKSKINSAASSGTGSEAGTRPSLSSTSVTVNGGQIQGRGKIRKKSKPLLKFSFNKPVSPEAIKNKSRRLSKIIKREKADSEASDLEELPEV